MKRLLSILLIPALVILISCGSENKEPENQQQTGMETQTAAEMHAGEVEEVLSASGYNYLKLNEKGQTYWIAVPTMDITVGELVYFSKAMKMENFKSETLNRTFDYVLFVDDASKTPMPEVQSPHSNLGNVKKQDITVEHLKDGYTVEQIFNKKESLNSKQVKVKGVVTKVNTGIMGKNWIHIQDGTGTDGAFDLVVTSDDVAKVGQTIIVEGTLATDKDFGSGYSYSVILENATLK